MNDHEETVSQRRNKYRAGNVVRETRSLAGNETGKRQHSSLVVQILEGDPPHLIFRFCTAAAAAGRLMFCILLVAHVSDATASASCFQSCPADQIAELRAVHFYLEETFSIYCRVPRAAIVRRRGLQLYTTVCGR